MKGRRKGGGRRWGRKKSLTEKQTKAQWPQGKKTKGKHRDKE